MTKNLYSILVALLLNRCFVGLLFLTISFVLASCSLEVLWTAIRVETEDIEVK